MARQSGNPYGQDEDTAGANGGGELGVPPQCTFSEVPPSQGNGINRELLQKPTDILKQGLGVSLNDGKNNRKSSRDCSNTSLSF